MKKINILMSTLLLFSLCALVVVFVINQNTYFELVGNEAITIKINSNYVDEGVTARVFKTDLSKHVQVKDKVDYSKVGTYSINYYLTYLGRIEMRTRTINIVDD